MLNITQSYDLLEFALAEEQRRKDNGIFYYKPHKKQDSFHRAGIFKRRFVRTGNRFGKSEMGSAEDVAWALGYRPWYPEGDEARYTGIPQKANKILVLCQDWDKVEEVFTNPSEGQALGKIFKFLPKDAIVGQPKKSKTGVISLIEVQSIWGGVSVILFDTVRSFQASEQSQESADFDAIHIDEPIPKKMWIANSRGLIDRSGSAWFTCTPLNQPWINEMFVPKELVRKDVEGALIKDKYHWMISGKTSDNPHNSAEAIELFEKDLTEAEKQCRLNGIPLTMSGIVYKEFNRDVHIYTREFRGWEAKNRPPKTYTIRVNVDPHPETPHAVLFAATAPNNQVFFFDEIFEQCLASTLCLKINEILTGYDLFEIHMDPAGFIESPTDGSSMASVFDSYGLFVEPAPKDLTRGINEVKMALNKSLRTPMGEVVPYLSFAEHLTETLFEFDAYQWNPKIPNKPIDKNDHMMENLYRMVLQGLHFVPSEKLNKGVVKRHEFGERKVWTRK